MKDRWHVQAIAKKQAGRKTYYHVTFINRLPKILMEGIVPGKRTVWMSRYGRKLGNRKVVYAHLNYEDAYRWAFKQAWDFKKHTIIIAFKEHYSKMIPNETLLGMTEYMKAGVIKPEQITDVFDPIDERVWNR